MKVLITLLVICDLLIGIFIVMYNPKDNTPIYKDDFNILLYKREVLKEVIKEKKHINIDAVDSAYIEALKY